MDVTIEFCNGKLPLTITISKNENMYAEDLTIRAAQFTDIGPVARHLFALWDVTKQVWLSPCHKFEINSSQKQLTLQFRLRFKPPTLDRLKVDTEAFDYYFLQLRSDFCAGMIPQVFTETREAFGLAVTDMLRKMLELKLHPSEVKWNFEDYLPEKLIKKYNKRKLGKAFQEALQKAWQNSNSDATYVKEQYIQQLCKLAPDHIYEHWKADVDEGERTTSVILIVNPYHSEQPGLRMRHYNSKNFVHICSIEDLCSISMRNDGTVEISRRNGIPQYLRFASVDEMHSFVSLLDGYYRLMEKWTFNLCKDFPTPSLQRLKIMKCHGPVGRKFSYQKLQEKSPRFQGSFILRQSSVHYDEYRLDMWPPSPAASGRDTSSPTTPITVCIKKSKEGFFLFDEPKEKFQSLQLLLAHHSKSSKGWNLRNCLPPSEFDKTPLLLCHVGTDNKDSVSKSQLGSFPQCFPISAIEFSDEPTDVFPGRYTVVQKAKLKKSDNEEVTVALKTLKPDLSSRYFREFITFCDKVMFWHSDSIASMMGVVLSNPAYLVMEYLPLGPLNAFLRDHASELQSVDLIESANYLARALWYLDENAYVHGNIRCRNVLVSAHTENSLRVKLVDPGPPMYTEDDVHWIPVECYSDFSAAQMMPSADVWAFGTTLWEIFSFGENQFENITPTVAKKLYLQGGRLPPPEGCPAEMTKVMTECWLRDPGLRKRPQSIMRDINQILYEVYNSRRTHSYADIYPTLKSPTESAQSSASEIAGSPAAATMKRGSKFSSILEALRSAASKQNGYGPLSNSTSISSEQSSLITECTDLDNSNLIILDYRWFRHLFDEPSMWSENFYCDSSGNSYDCPETSPWLIEAGQLIFGEPLGQGCFGAVYKAVLNRWSGLKPEVVAVKRINERIPDDTGISDLRREIAIMLSLHHKNIVEIIGYVEEPQIMLVMEYLEQGCLIAYLKMYKEKLPHSQLLKFAIDIAEGMEYLEKKNIVHRDLAARNILVASEDHVKISDFGLAQFTENQYYHVKTQQRGLPLHWYAPEAIKYLKFSSKSDVWSYGVTLWEMFSYGMDPVISTSSSDGSTQSPGEQMHFMHLIDHLNKGHRLQIPSGCPAIVYQIMMHCWHEDPHQRPNFTQLLDELNGIKETI